ncbi:alpha/beta hydrolase domain-containing protein, partial [Nocardioides hankookensis]
GTSGLKAVDPERYGALSHPGDAYAYDIYTQVARGLAADLGATCVLAVGESQSAFALTTYVNDVHDRTRVFDGFLVHSRPGSAMPLGEPGQGIDLAVRIDLAPTPIRDDTDVPVIIVQTEGDLFGRIAYLRARQPDAAQLRLWEVAGAAHADHFQIGDFETFLGCPDPVNRGQQAYVVRAALRWLESWA